MSNVVLTEEAPIPVGPYSQAVITDDMVYCSGQLGIDPRTKKLVEGDMAEQTRQCLCNLEAVLKASGSSMSSVVRTTVYLTDLKEFKEMNEVYARFFPTHPPSRSTVGVSQLVLGAKVEIDAIAMLE